MEPARPGRSVPDDGPDQVASAADQVSSASQSPAEGASEQAASIEETSSSLEEMASMTRRNADHAALLPFSSWRAPHQAPGPTPEAFCSSRARVRASGVSSPARDTGPGSH